MGSNYERFLHIISKWPLDLNRKSMDYGHHLRQLIKNKNVDGNVFPGSTAENSKMLDSLLRLLKNTYKNAYPFTIKQGRGSGFNEKAIEEILDSGINQHPDKSIQEQK